MDFLLRDNRFLFNSSSSLPCPLFYSPFSMMMNSPVRFSVPFPGYMIVLSAIHITTHSPVCFTLYSSAHITMQSYVRMIGTLLSRGEDPLHPLAVAQNRKFNASCFWSHTSFKIFFLVPFCFVCLGEGKKERFLCFANPPLPPVTPTPTHYCPCRTGGWWQNDKKMTV